MFIDHYPLFKRLGIDTALVGGKTSDFMDITKESDKIISIKITDLGIEKLKNHADQALLNRKNNIDTIIETIMIDDREMKIFQPIMQDAIIFFLHASDEALRNRENARNNGNIKSEKRPDGAAVVEAKYSEKMYQKIKNTYKINYIDTSNKNTKEVCNNVINIYKMVFFRD